MSNEPLLKKPWRPPGPTVNARRAAKLLDCDVKIVVKLCVEGKLHSFKRTEAGHWVILRDSVFELAERWRKQAGFDEPAPRRPR